MIRIVAAVFGIFGDREGVPRPLDSCTRPDKPHIIVITNVHGRNRLPEMVKRLESIHVRNFEVVVGIDVKAECPDYKNSACRGVVHVDGKPGDLGCALSHRDAWTRALKHKWTIVLEDDAIPFAGFDTLPALPPDTDYFHMGPVRCNAMGKGACGSVVPVKEGMYGTVAYAVPASGAQRLLNQTTTVGTGIDHTIFGSSRLNTFCDLRALRVGHDGNVNDPKTSGRIQLNQEGSSQE